MITREFYSENELDERTRELATARRHPVYFDPCIDYEEFQQEDSVSEYSTIVPLPDRSAIWNDRDDRLSYLPTGKYNLVQHREVIDAIKHAVDMTVGTIDFGMIRDYGEQIDGILVFGNQSEANIDLAELLGEGYIPPEERPDTDPTAETSGWRDAVGLGMRFTNSFNGDKKVGGSTMGYRYICQNWMVWNEAEIGSKATSHVRDVDDTDGLAEDFFVPLIDEVFNIRADVEDVIRDAESTIVPVGWVPGLLEKVGFGRNYRRRITARALGQHRPEENETTIWRLYNAVTNELDHETAPETSLGVYNLHQTRAWNLVSDDVEEPDEWLTMSELEEFVS